MTRAQRLANVMTACGFMDSETIGGVFTWRKNIQQGVHVRKKLDRCVADVDWRLLFQHSLVEVLNPHDSDHNPLLLSCMKARTNRLKSFHFQAAWLSHPDYGALVDNSWKHAPGDVVAKLGNVRNQSIEFNKETFGNTFKKKRQLQGRIREVHRELDIYPYANLILLERELQNEYDTVLAQEEMLWYQKSREKWVKFGNKNTKFFHTQTGIRRRHNKVMSLNVDGF